MPAKIIQLTDCHLFDDPAVELRGVATRARFEATLAAVRERFPDFDLMVITGDLAHDELRSTYLQLRELLDDFAERVRVIPGNHDNREFMSEVFPLASGYPVESRITFEEGLSGWRLIGLDTLVPKPPERQTLSAANESFGGIGSDQLAWLRGQLAASTEHTLLFTHHPPNDIRSSWLDAIGLKDREDLRAIADEFPHVRLVVSGHVHQASSCKFESAVAYTTPSIGPSFRPHCETISIGNAAPGFRIIELEEDGSWWTQTLDAN